MNPKPLVSLNHFTLPVLRILLFSLSCGHKTERDLSLYQVSFEIFWPCTPVEPLIGSTNAGKNRPFSSACQAPSLSTPVHYAGHEEDIPCRSRSRLADCRKSLRRRGEMDSRAGAPARSQMAAGARTGDPAGEIVGPRRRRPARR